MNSSCVVSVSHYKVIIQFEFEVLSVYIVIWKQGFIRPNTHVNKTISEDVSRIAGGNMSSMSTVLFNGNW